MKRALVVEFTKMNGAGNDFIVIDNRFFHFSAAELSALARRFCPRRTGIGADGLLAFTAPDDPAHHFRMIYYNADGSRATMCGNGARCLARYGRQAGIAAAEMLLESDAGIYRALVPEAADAPVRLYVDDPKDWTPEVALDGPSPLDGPLHYIWTGTEHTVCFVPDVQEAPVTEAGRRIRHDAALAPAGANVNVVEVRERGGGGAPAALAVRTYEKGVEAETQACGTGAIAAAVAARLTEHIDGEEVAVRMPGGVLMVGFTVAEAAVTDVYLEGPTAFVFRGTVEL